MGNACIAYDNLADGAALSASSSAIQMPPTMLQNPHVTRKWRGGSSITDYVLANLGSLQSLDTIAVLGINAASAQVRVSSVDSSGAAGDLYDSGVVAVDQDYVSIIDLLPAAVNGQYVRIDFTNPDGPFVEAGRLFIGVRTQFDINFNFGWGRGYMDRSIISKTRGGQTQVYDDVVYRTLDLTFGFASSNQRYGIIETIDRVNGTKTDVLMITDPDSDNLARDTIWGLVTDLTAVASVAQIFDVFSKEYKIEERL